jgi:hypothetical protein
MRSGDKSGPELTLKSSRPGLCYSHRWLFQHHRSKAEVVRSFDRLVGDGDQPRRNVYAQRLGCLEIDHQFELDRRLYRQVGGLFPLENSADINASQAI